MLNRDRVTLHACRLAVLLLSLLALPRLAIADAPCPAAPRQALALPATRTALLAHRPVTIVAFGSSSTQGIGATTPDHTYPAQLQALLRARWPDAEVTVINRGIGGQTIDSMLARIVSDVIDPKPVLVIWQTGTNDALRHVNTATFTAALEDGVKKIHDAGADVVLMDDQLGPRLAALDDQMTYDDIMAHTAQAGDAELFSRAHLMKAWFAAGEPMNAVIGPDGLHHTDRGYACVARALADAIVSGSEIRVGGKR
jgi:lysophospholipase L1-like esterase